MKGVIIYKGKYGATAQYAAWLAEALYLPVIDTDHQSVSDLSGYDYIIIGSPVYVGKLLIRDWLHKNAAILQGKKVFLFIVSSVPDDDKRRQETVIKANIPEELARASLIYFARGRVIVNKLSWTDKLMIKMGAIMEKDPEKKALMRRGFDGMKRENINPLIKNVLQYSNSEALL